MAEPHILPPCESGIMPHTGDKDDHGDQETKNFADSNNGRRHKDVSSVTKTTSGSSLDVSVTKPYEVDMEFVNINTRFDGNRDSEVELRQQLSFTDIPLDAEEDEIIPCTSDVTTRAENVWHGDDDSSESIMQRLSQMFAVEKAKEKLRQLSIDPNDMKLTRDFNGDIDMASAVYSEEAITRVDTLSYHGYTIRAQGADVCINSVHFNQGGHRLRVEVKVAEYDEFYRGEVTRIKSQPKIIVDSSRWTMLYGTFDDDCIGVLEVEVPPGVCTSEIKCEGPSDGFITITIPSVIIDSDAETRVGTSCMDGTI